MTASTATPRIPQWTLGDRLRKAREHAYMDQEELALRMGVSRGTVSNYELGRGTRPPKVVVLRAWAKECGVPYEWIVDGFRAPTARVTTPANPGYSLTAALPERFYIGDLLAAV
jgi:transcriptional regulator with XRE-family HTH domain